MLRLIPFPLRLTVILVLTVLAAGCVEGRHRPKSFATCGTWYEGGGIDAVRPQVFDCLARAYRQGCAATDVTITPFGVDTFDRYHLWLYRSGSRCVGNLVHDYRRIGGDGTVRADCGDTYLVGGQTLRETLIFSECGKEGAVNLVRGKACPITIAGPGAPKKCRQLGRRVSKKGTCVVPQTAIEQPRFWC
jgi:hypothetical protein